jgi:hypothetical protein
VVDVAAFEREPFLRAETCPGGEDGDRAERRAELLGDRVDLVRRAERENLSPLRLRVRHR